MAGTRIYPWEKWFKKKKFKLKRGVEYNCLPNSMSLLVRRVAKERGVKISIQNLDEKTMLVTVLERTFKKELGR